MELQGRYDEIKRQGLGLVSISYDPPETLKKFADSRGITFPLVSDPGSAVIRRYGLFNDTVDPKTRAYGIPHPGTFILDTKGNQNPAELRSIAFDLPRSRHGAAFGKLVVKMLSSTGAS